MIRVVDTLTMIEFATQKNFDRHDMYLITMWFVIVNEGVQGSIALQCPNTQPQGYQARLNI